MNSESSDAGSLLSMGILRCSAAASLDHDHIHPSSPSYVELGPQEQEQRSEAHEERSDDGQHKLHKQVFLGRHAARKERRHEDQAQHEEARSEHTVRVRRHGRGVRDFLQQHKRQQEVLLSMRCAALVAGYLQASDATSSAPLSCAWVKSWSCSARVHPKTTNKWVVHGTITSSIDLRLDLEVCKWNEYHIGRNKYKILMPPLRERLQVA